MECCGALDILRKCSKLKLLLISIELPLNKTPSMYSKKVFALVLLS